MSRFSPIVAIAATFSLLTATEVAAQQVAAGGAGDSAAAAPVAPVGIPRSQRPSVMVMNFEFSAPLASEDLEELNSFAGAIAALKGNGAAANTQQTGVNLGKAAADMIMERLLATAQFRVLERKALEEVNKEQALVESDRSAANQDVAQRAKLIGARFMITGSITKFGRSQQKKHSGLGLITKAVAGVDIQSKQTNYEIGLTSRIVDTSTGEVIASVTSDATVVGDKGRSIAGLGGTLGGVAGALGSKSATGEREKRIAESLQLAVDKLVTQYVIVRERGDLNPQ